VFKKGFPVKEKEPKEFWASDKAVRVVIPNSIKKALRKPAALFC
jgi:hypothetical protein